MKKLLRQAFDDVLDLVYPRICFCCQRETPTPGETTCLACRSSLAYTNFHQHKQNSFTERFLGRLPLYTGAAYYHYRKGSLVRKMIYQLKYHGKKEIGIEIGKAYGFELKESQWYQDVDIILPVPLHKRRKRERGFNQSDMFAKGLSEAMEIPWSPEALIRTTYTDTQTRKDKFDRLENMTDVFAINNTKSLEGKHILLVDDVLTTGATLEFCGACLTAIPDARVSMATIALAST